MNFPRTRYFGRHLTMTVVATLLVGCGGGERAPANADIPAEGLAAIDTAGLMAHIRVLAHDSLLGRAPGSLGEDR
ncbi:MAG: hypothetical protein JNL26_01885, partial [Gemmatimonadetes bacterium]|nr:hypothetical protein [Gemmatimonadota bacterium]